MERTGIHVARELSAVLICDRIQGLGYMSGRAKSEAGRE